MKKVFYMACFLIDGVLDIALLIGVANILHII